MGQLIPCLPSLQLLDHAIKVDLWNQKISFRLTWYFHKISIYMLCYFPNYTYHHGLLQLCNQKFYLVLPFCAKSSFCASGLEKCAFKRQVTFLPEVFKFYNDRKMLHSKKVSMCYNVIMSFTYVIRPTFCKWIVQVFTPLKWCHSCYDCVF